MRRTVVFVLLIIHLGCTVLAFNPPKHPGELQTLPLICYPLPTLEEYQEIYTMASGKKKKKRRKAGLLANIIKTGQQIVFGGTDGDNDSDEEDDDVVSKTSKATDAKARDSQDVVPDGTTVIRIGGASNKDESNVVFVGPPAPAPVSYYSPQPGYTVIKA